ncbi:MAG: T9SS type A sorting domain-containing protein [Lewinellaceae bacterium]|nr:T9SS type A sorting domain-containing protein [Lewinellaceae bacterium]
MKYNLLIILLFSLFGTTHAEKFYLDPSTGHLANAGTIDAPWSTLEAVINANYIVSNQYSPLPYNPATSKLISKNASGYVHAGDTLVLMNGLHGNVFLNNYINTVPITIIGMEGQTPIIEKMHLRACKNWRIENVVVSSEPYGLYLNDVLFYIESHSWQGPSSHIEVHHCEIYSTDTPWQTADDWNTKMSNGLYIKADSVIATNNLIRNINFGLQAVGNYIEADHNQIINFAGDGMRIVGSNIIFKYNLIKNCYKVNENHDDGIQSWAQINGVIADDNQVIGNIIINTDDPSRPLNGPLQGIGCFDGFYNRWKVVNNLIVVDHWHGITFLGANDCQIINNTVLDLTPDITPGGSWIRINNHKDGSPSSGCLVANNVANSFYVDGTLTNNVVLNTYQQYANNFIDYTNFDFHLLPTSTLIDGADPVYAPNIDIEENGRPFGDLPDIGAYEFSVTTSTFLSSNRDGFHVYPNPFSDFIIIEGNRKDYQIEIWDLSGNLIFTKSCETKAEMNQIDLSSLKKGIYFLTIKGTNNEIYKTIKLVKLMANNG